MLSGLAHKSHDESMIFIENWEHNEKFLCESILYMFERIVLSMQVHEEKTIMCLCNLTFVWPILASPSLVRLLLIILSVRIVPELTLRVNLMFLWPNCALLTIVKTRVELVTLSNFRRDYVKVVIYYDYNWFCIQVSPIIMYLIHLLKKKILYSYICNLMIKLRRIYGYAYLGLKMFIRLGRVLVYDTKELNKGHSFPDLLRCYYGSDVGWMCIG